MFGLDHPSVTNPDIDGIEITVDGEGRFSLRALHKASGGKKRYKPNYWLETNSTQAFITTVRKQTKSIPVICKDGRNGGTYACELVAIKYAGWIAPAFCDKVKQAFVDYRSGKFTHPFVQRNLTKTQSPQLRLPFVETTI